MVVSSGIALTLLGVASFTVLPVFYRLCPFQTPTGWALVWLARPLYRALLLLATIAYGIPSLLFVLCTSGYEPGWLVQPLVSLMIKWNQSKAETLKNWRAYGLFAVQDPAHCMAAVPGVRAACALLKICQADLVAVDAIQTHTLTRALAWVRSGSTDEGVFSAVRDALPTLHEWRPTTAIGERSITLSAIYAICPSDLLHTCNMIRLYLLSPNDSRSFNARLLSPFGCHARFGPFLDVSTSMDVRREYPATLHCWASTPASLQICHSLIHLDLLALVDDWLSVMTDEVARSTVAKKISFLFAVLRVMPSSGVDAAIWLGDADLVRPLANALEEVYYKLAPYEVAYVDGLVPMCVELCRLLGRVSFERVRGEQHIIGGWSFEIAFRV